MNAISKLNKELLFIDGALGTMLQKAGLKPGENPELLNITNPKAVIDIHRAYIEAGADIITANTFGANILKLKNSGYSLKDVIFAAVKNAKDAGAKTVALDIGPCGQLLKPAGTLSFEDAVAVFKETVTLGKEAGADLVIIETMSDLYELKAAVLAVKESSSLPVFASLSFEPNHRTFMGADALTAVTLLNGLGVDAAGINCCSDPRLIDEEVRTFLKYSLCPVLVMPNAGLPVFNGNGEAEYNLSPENFANKLSEYYRYGAGILGGCCGTTPEHIKKLTSLLKGKPLKKRTPLKITAVSSASKTVILDGKTSVIGERLNPTGKPLLKAALSENDTAFIIKEALSQVDSGADILDLNCGLPDKDEAALLKNSVTALQSVMSVPLQLDSSNASAIEAAARVYNGKPLINSVNGSVESIEKIFPIVKKYGGVVIGLTLDENGVPDTAKERFKIAKTIVESAKSYGIDKSDILIDCLVLTASAQQKNVFETLKTIRLVKSKLGVKTVLGVSNVSFGLPARPLLNSVFFASALSYGLDAAIINPLSGEMMNALYAFRVLSGEDKNSEFYIDNFAPSAEKTTANAPASDNAKDLPELILSGQKDAAVTLTYRLLENLKPLEIVDNLIIPALNKAGEKYEKGSLFLPSLINCAETAKACFDVIFKSLTSDNLKKDKIVLATVEGDIHDIGKNIVKVLLQSYGYQVIDLGRDVKPDAVVEAVKANNIKLCGLSALMTTTIPAMKKTIEKLRLECPDCTVMVGGAVLNEDYKDFVGADFYAPDAMASVKIADKVFFVTDKAQIE